MKNIKSAIFRLLAGCVLVCHVASVHAYSNLVIFGDSLSDTGNLSGIFGLPFPYYNNRISDGPVAVDVIANYYGLSTARSRHLFSSTGGENYAVVGANAGGTDIEDLANQVSAFAGRHPGGLTGTSLYTIIIGGNDIRDTLDQLSASTRTATLTLAVNGITEALQQIIALGATDILVVNAPDISAIPETLQAVSNDPGIISRAHGSSIEFNNLLTTAIMEINSTSGINIIEYDLFGYLTQVTTSFIDFGFTNIIDPCYDADSFTILPGCDFSAYMYFDNIHPTGRTHDLLGNDIVRVLEGVPQIEPWRALVPLMNYYFRTDFLNEG